MKRIVIIGAGPAGLTAALELQKAGEKHIWVVESDSQVGGLAKTIEYKGNRIDIGGHRFFSKSDWVVNWWTDILPVDHDSTSPVNLRYQGQGRDDLPASTAHASSKRVMLVRRRLSRIYFNRMFFDYPLKLSFATLQKLGLRKTISFGFSYLWSRVLPISPEKSLEDFLTNRFGKRLFRQFFQAYTEKVWGVPCAEISAEWGAQRIKSLSITKALWHAVKKSLGMAQNAPSQISLIENFLYPKYGPGQIWEIAAERFVAGGGVLELRSKVDHVDMDANIASRVRYTDKDGVRQLLHCTHIISTMPIKDLINASAERWPAPVRKIANELAYRDFITVGLLYRASDLKQKLDDTWIYIQEPGVQVGRVQIFNNWSPGMVADPGTVWLGLEFFCMEGDALWQRSDADLQQLAVQEMFEIGLTLTGAALDGVVIRIPKAYPGYFGAAYQNFNQVRAGLDEIKNLFLVGRNGMHRYNNQDHSMLTAAEAARQIVSGQVDKARIWDINIGDDYHEVASRKTD